MAYRQHDYRDPCVYCDQLSVQRCLRCDRPLCAVHGPVALGRCHSCESEFEQRIVEHIGHEPPARGPNVSLAIFLSAEGGLFVLLMVLGPRDVAGLVLLLTLLLVSLGLAVKSLSPDAESDSYAMWHRQRQRLRERFMEESLALAPAPEADRHTPGTFEG